MEASRTKRKLVFSSTKFETMKSKYDAEGSIQEFATKYGICECAFRKHFFPNKKDKSA